MFYIRFATLEERTRYIKKLKKQDILAVFHYISLHSNSYYSLKKDGRVLPNTDQFTDTLLRLPMYYELSENEIDTIVNCFKIGKIC
jgi:dTDP-4-amino-4,6-dideoxygalactose transaminase